VKTFYAALGIVAIAAVAAIFIFSRPPCPPCHPGGPLAFTLCIKGRGNDQFFQHPHFGDFNTKACDLKNAGGDVKLRYKANSTATEVDYDPCSPPAAIETAKVTKTEGADSAAAGASAANDPSVTYHVRTNDLQKLNAVLDTFK
jgi:hypothetical protein